MCEIQWKFREKNSWNKEGGGKTQPLLFNVKKGGGIIFHWKVFLLKKKKMMPQSERKIILTYEKIKKWKNEYQ